MKIYFPQSFMSAVASPLDWATTKKLVKERNYESLKILRRSPEMQLEYRKHREKVLP